MSKPSALTFTADEAIAAVAALLAVVAVLTVAATPARAAWPPSGLPLASGPTQQVSPIGSTGPGGELHTFWQDLGPSAAYALFSQHLTLQGTVVPGWPPGGRGVVDASARISSPKLMSDGAGGAILDWYDNRNSGGARGIYAIRADANAAVAPGWLSSGTPICTTTNAQGLGPINDLTAICTDGAGGAFIAWTDARNTPPASTLVYDVFAQHVLSSGALDPVWPVSGRPLTTGPGYKYPHGLIADASGGFWLVTEQSNATDLIAATHHSADGTELGRWNSPSYASREIAVSDGAGGVLMTWRDCRDCLSGSDAIYAIRLAGAAAPKPGWPIGGTAIGASAGDDDLPVLVGTGDGGAVVAWLQTGTSAPDAYVARRVEAGGTFASPWLGGGRVVAKSDDILSGWPFIVSDGVGGAMFGFRRNTPNLFGSRVTAGSQVPAVFPDTGLALCTLSGNQFAAGLVSDGLNGAFMLWEDRRDYAINNYDVYVTRFTRDGVVGSTTGVTPPPVVSALALSAPRPNPSSAVSTLQLSMPATGRARVAVFDLTGRLVAVLHHGDLAAGTHPLQWDGLDQDGRRRSAGVYLVQVSAGHTTVTQRIVRMP